jgi:protein TonB
MRRIGRGVCLLLALSWLLGVYNCGWSSGSPPQSATPPAHEIAVDMTEDVKPLPAPTVVAGVADEERATWPAYDDSVRVDEPALPIHKVPPVYPDLAREKGQQGILWVQTLVRTNGLVGATLVTRGNAYLNAAAVEAVSQWTFKPALADGKVVATWCAVPVKFTLH